MNARRKSRLRVRQYWLVEEGEAQGQRRPSPASLLQTVRKNVLAGVVGRIGDVDAVLQEVPVPESHGRTWAGGVGEEGASEGFCKIIVDESLAML